MKLFIVPLVIALIILFAGYRISDCLHHPTLILKMTSICLDSKFDELDHEGLVRLRMKLEKERSPSYPDDLLEAHMQFRLSDREKARRLLDFLEDMKLQDNEGQAFGLDIGSGTGAGVLAI